MRRGCKRSARAGPWPELGHSAHAATAATVLRAIAADPEVEPYERAMAWHVLADHDYAEFHPAALALRGLSLTALEPADRRHAAKAVTERCPSVRPAAVTVLRNWPTIRPAPPPIDDGRRPRSPARWATPGRVLPSLLSGVHPLAG